MSRQNYYARRKLRQRRQIDAELIGRLVQQERHWQPRLGARKLRVLLAEPLAQAQVRIGRDRFFEVLRHKDLLLKPRRSEKPRTTHSAHARPVFRNLIKGRALSRPNQVWVGDLTYLRTEEGFMFLALLTDKMSRKIVGYHCGDRLESTGCQEALKMALKQLEPGERPIHHSDRGSQYCCHDYVQLAAAGGLMMSMTETDHCAENALAERVNGILKTEYGLDRCFKSKAQSSAAVAQAIQLYDTRRPHSALGDQFPAAVHACGRPGDWAPPRYDRSRELGFERPAPLGAIPVADPPVAPLRAR